MQTRPGRLEFFIRGERFAVYRPQAPWPGFTGLYAPGGRALTCASSDSETALWITPAPAAIGVEGLSPVSVELIARRGAYSVGFQHTLRWQDRAARICLEETRIARIAPGPAEGGLLDLTLHLSAPGPLRLEPQTALLRLRLAGALLPSGGGQLRSSAGEYGPTAIHRSSATWCAGVGVVAGETVGLALLDHPNNPDHPPVWIAQEDGLLAPALSALEITPRRLILRYRLLAHRGYVDAGWADARLKEFASS